MNSKLSCITRFFRRPEGGVRSLDGVRGLAVLLVLLDHAGDDGMHLFAGADLDRIGKYGVFLFFALSAFLLTFPFLDWGNETLKSGRAWGNYLLRRFVRIFPLYGIVLCYTMWEGNLGVGEFVNHLLLRDGQWHFWTIPVEFKYYLVMPFVALVFVLVVRRRWWMALGMLAGLIAFLGLVFFPLEELWSVDGEVDLSGVIRIFLMGSGAGFLYWYLLRRGGLPKWGRWLSEVVAVLCLLAMVMRIPAVYEWMTPARDNITEFDHDTTFCAVVWPLFLVSCLNGVGWVRRLFEWGPLCFLGMISYSAYLWHRAVLEFCDGFAGSPVMKLTLFLGAIIFVATVSYLVVERPLSRVRIVRKHEGERKKG